MEIFGDLNSGNCWKVKVVADRLGLDHRWIPVDLRAGETRAEDFRALAPMGQIPIVRFGDGRTLAQSNAIMAYLAEGSALLPEDRFLRAKTQEWLFWEQYDHEPYIAVCRFQMVWLGRPKAAREEWRVARGERALDLLDTELSKRDWLVGDDLTIADIGLLAYTRVAHEGGFDLTGRSAIRAWIERCEAALTL